MVVCAGVAAQADPIFTEDFSAAQTKQPTDPAYYEFINLQEGDNWAVANGELSMDNNAAFPCTNQTWQRAIKFRNLPLKEKTLYKLSFDINPVETPVDEATFENAPGFVDVKLMQGDENADICIIDAAGAEQRANIQLNKGEAQKITKLFYFADLAKQNEKYEASCAGKENYAPQKFFAGFNVYAPGKYTVDNFLLDEASPLEKVEFNSYNVRMKYGSAINASALLNGAKRKIYDASIATVKVNGTAVEIEDVELQSDGYLYIFAVEEIPAEAQVEVTLNAPEDVQFTGGWAGLPLSFSGVKAEFSEDEVLAAAVPFSFAPAEIVKSFPADDSFALPTTLEKITIEFDHEISSEGLVAECSNGTKPAILSVEGKVVTLAGGEFPKGAYTITLKNVKNVGTDTPTEGDPSISFETGEIKLAETIYTDVFTDLFQGEANGIPTGWTCMVKADNWTGGEVWGGGSACRNFIIGSGENTQTSFYLCDRDGFTFLVKGDKEEDRMVLPAGDIAFSVLAVGHEAPSRTVELRIEDLAGNVIATGKGNTSTQAEQFSSVGALEPIMIKFKNPTEQPIVVKIHEPEGGFTACRVVGIKAQTYVETEGDKFEPEVVFDSQFTGDLMPAEGSGWFVYENNNPLAPGSGRSGTSGILARNFHAKMQSAAFFRECGDNPEAAMRLEYGNGNGVEGGFHMEPGKYELTYYAGTWNDPQGNAEGRSKVFMDLIDAATGQVVFHSEHVNKANFENGGACNGQADKITEKVSCAGGNFIVKLWGTHNTVLGSLSITKEGSLAAKWYSKVAEAVEDAKLELTASEAENLNGTAKIALSQAIAKYEKPSGMYTEAEFQNAINELNDAAKDMKARREAMGVYNSVIGNIAGTVADAEEKFKQLESYQVLAELNEKYGASDPVALENEELIPLAYSLQSNYNTYTYMAGTGVNLLTKQIQDLKTGIMNLPGNEAYAGILAVADNAVTDDQALVEKLKLVYTKLIYDACATSENPFVEVDPELLVETPKAMEATGFIQNANCYCTQAAVNGDTRVDNDAFPGWNIETKQGYVRASWATTWGENYPTAEKPVADCGIKAGWGDFEYKVEQLLTNLPVGIYEFSVQMGEDGIPSTRTDESVEEVKSFAYVGDKKLTYDGDLQEDGTVKCSRDFNSEANTKTFTEVEPVVAAGEVRGTLTIGVNMNLKATHGGLDNFKLKLVAKKAGFDYAAAAKALDAIITGVENAQDESAVAKAKNAVTKLFKNGQVLIQKAGKMFNAAGSQVK